MLTWDRKGPTCALTLLTLSAVALYVTSMSTGCETRNHTSLDPKFTQTHQKKGKYTRQPNQHTPRGSYSAAASTPISLERKASSP